MSDENLLFGSEALGRIYLGKRFGILSNIMISKHFRYRFQTLGAIVEDLVAFVRKALNCRESLIGIESGDLCVGESRALDVFGD